MSFTSVAFVAAFPIFCGIFFNTPARHQRTVLLGGSLSACALAGPASFGWLVAVTVLGYAFGRSLGRSRSAWRLAGAIGAILAPLLVMKYTNFALTSWRDAAAWAGIAILEVPRIDLATPAGLSFYTFAVIGYLVDVHVERIGPERRFTRFAIFTSFFPKFVAGPVERATTFLPQLDTAKRFDYARVADGLLLIAWGFFKKLVVADHLADIVNAAYSAPGEYHGLALLLAVVFYAFQIYYDFSGYSDIAVGSARVLGYDLTLNFNRPYAARSVSDFWRRWHISLTTWFFDYIFWPIVGSLRRRGKAAVVVAIAVTFLVSGLWHGAHWTFVLYGAMHGFALCFEYLTAGPRKFVERLISARLYAVAAWLTTFTFLLCAFLVFRADSVTQALAIASLIAEGAPADVAFLVQSHLSPAAIEAVFGTYPTPGVEFFCLIGAIAMVEGIGWLGARGFPRERLLGLPTPLRWSMYYALLGSIVFYGAHNIAPTFVYMQF